MATNGVERSRATDKGVIGSRSEIGLAYQEICRPDAFRSYCASRLMTFVPMRSTSPPAGLFDMRCGASSCRLGRFLQAAGAVVNSFVRDAAGIEALCFPTFCRGLYAQDQGPRGKVIDFRTPIEIEAVRIAPGDLIFGDREGVLIIPSEVEGEAVAAALAKACTESKVATAIRGA
jgi:hypothetical protein